MVMGRSMPMPTAETAMKGSDVVLKVASKHAVNGNPTREPFDPKFHLMVGNIH